MLPLVYYTCRLVFLQHLVGQQTIACIQHSKHQRLLQCLLTVFVHSELVLKVHIFEVSYFGFRKPRQLLQQCLLVVSVYSKLKLEVACHCMVGVLPYCCHLKMLPWYYTVASLGADLFESFCYAMLPGHPSCSLWLDQLPMCWHQ